MNATDWTRVREVFDRVAECETAERNALLDALLSAAERLLQQQAAQNMVESDQH